MKKTLRRIIMLICIVVFCFSAYKLIEIGLTYYQIEHATKDLINEYTKETKSKKLSAYDKALRRQIDFVQLKKRNPDVIGWIYIPGTNLDEVVLKGKNNDTYLRHDIDHKYNVAGQIFIDEINKKDFTDMNTIIYGHHMYNGTRFALLRKYYHEKDYYNKHRDIFIYTPDGKVHVYKTFSMRVLDAYSPLYTNNSDYKDYIKKMQSGAKYKSQVSDKQAPLIMLSTCQHATGDNRFVLSARQELVQDVIK